MDDLTAINGSGSHPFKLPDTLWMEMLAHVLACFPEEACGLVGIERKDGETSDQSPASVVLPVENELHSRVRFRMAPAEQLKAFYWLEDHDLDLAAIFHSHPQGPHHPSATDLAEFAYPGVLMLILSPLDFASPLDSAENWAVRAYRIDGGLSSRLSASEVPLARVPRLQRGDA